MQIEMKKELTGRVLVVTVEEDVAKGDFGTDLLQYNALEGVLCADVRRIDEQTQFTYELGARLTLPEWLKQRALTTIRLRKLVQVIIDVLQNMQEYFLDEKDLIIISDYIFIEEETEKVYFAYMEGYNGDVGKELSKMFETLMEYMNHQDKDLVFLVYGMHRQCLQDNFSLKTLGGMVATTEHEKQPGYAGQLEHTENSGYAGQPGHTENSRYTEQTGDAGYVGQIGHMGDSGFAKHVHQKKECLSPKVYKGAANRVMYKVMILPAVIGVVLFVAVLKSGVLNRPVSGKPDIMKILVLAAVILIIEGYIFDKERKKSKNNQQTDSGSELRQAAEQEEETTLLVDTYSDETVVLQKREEKSLFVNLIPSDWSRQEIKIRKSPFYIGKDAAKVDGVIGEPQVSRSHIKIVMEEGKVYAIDQESTNGTYVNGNRMTAWERQPILNGDSVCIASIHYQVEVYE